MVYYGEWEQRPDYTYPADVPATIPGVSKSSGEQSVTPHQAFDMEGVYVPLVSSVMHPSSFAVSSEAVPAARMSAGFTRRTLLNRSDYDVQGWNWFTWRHGRTGRSRAPAAELPPGAIGVQYEGLSTIVGATARLRGQHETVNMGGVWFANVYAFQPGGYMQFNTTAQPPQLVSWDAASALGSAIIGYDANSVPILNPDVAGHVTAFPGPQVHDSIVDNGDIDVSAHLFDDDGVLALLNWLRIVAAPAPGLDASGTTGSGIVGLRLVRDAVASGVGMELTYTYRPAPHRFIYERKPELPITRVHPRDDGRGTASAARVYPPPKSRQGSNRQGPGSYR